MTRRPAYPGGAAAPAGPPPGGEAVVARVSFASVSPRTVSVSVQENTDTGRLPMSGKFDRGRLFRAASRYFFSRNFRSARELAEVLGCSLSTAYRLRGEGGEEGAPSAELLDAIRDRYPREWALAKAAVQARTVV
ncbi:MAG: hypothetical protein Tsb0020_54410 [Haliangiales bacterium]